MSKKILSILSLRCGKFCKSFTKLKSFDFIFIFVPVHISSNILGWGSWVLGETVRLTRVLFLVMEQKQTDDKRPSFALCKDRKLRLF